ncbi:hypothetical protein AJ79_05361 [Helicocarpus griseus UAMH5409]|uniref:Aminoglycoside phosphotransferase domain-containing protein n=1 Tax=Helicocarpus griseus UAMH5409 TaxID=1447875 RepID=A0A2B7XQ76_9EURO|nr:hypothetical protein AJ79_05361 [Helicocarpus griseus UAMH5409]
MSDNDNAEPENQATPGNPSYANNAKPLLLLDRFITLSAAQAQEQDMTVELQYADKRAKFYSEFEIRQDEIRQLVAFHCGLANPDLVQVPATFGKNNELIWQHGSFNMCIPVSINRSGLNHVTSSLPTRLAFRVPLPYKVGEEMFPGNSEEKVRSEAATYIWLERNCPDIPVPKLRGFGMAGGLSFCQVSYIPFWSRINFHIQRFIRFILRTPGLYADEHAPRRRKALLDYSYILIDWIEDPSEEMLSKSFFEPHTEEQTKNLYRGISEIMISLARLPQPRIGSWTINNEGHVTLTNRPMFCHLHMFENWSIPSGIPRNTTYTSADSLYLDLITGHDNRLLYQKNSAYNKLDAQTQAKDLVLMRALLHQFTCRHLHSGPFIMQLTDMHASNIFVDKHWNIKHIIDLEWACSLSLADLQPPYWLTGKGIDEFEGAEYTEFKNSYNQFVDIFEQVEAHTNTEPLHHGEGVYSRAALMKTALEDCRYWYFSALMSPKGLFNVFRMHIQSVFDAVPKETLRDGVSPFWRPGMASFINSKMDEYTQYQHEIRDLFHRN